MTDRELLRQVLDAWQDHWVSDIQSALLEAIRANCANCARCGEKNPAEIHTCTPKREWQGLTDEEILEFEIWLDDEEEKHSWNPPADIVKYIEAKLKDKNT